MADKEDANVEDGERKITLEEAVAIAFESLKRLSEQMKAKVYALEEVEFGSDHFEITISMIRKGAPKTELQPPESPLSALYGARAAKQAVKNPDYILRRVTVSESTGKVKSIVSAD